MEGFLEPIFLNEKMMLNTAAYLFKGVTLKEEITTDTSVEKKGKGSLGFKFLQDLFSPLSVSGEIDSTNKQSLKSARTYTLGGLHMAVIEELKNKKQIEEIFLPSSNIPRNKFVSLNVVLKPVDFYQLLEVVKLVKPLIIQILRDFGTKINPQVFNKNAIKDISKYDQLIDAIITSLENDYLNSKQLEMLMIAPDGKNIVGIVDIDLSGVEAQEIKAKLNDGQFIIIGKVSRFIDEGEYVSMVQRTILSKIVELIGKGVSLNPDPKQILNYKVSLMSIKPIVEKFVKLNLPGPAIRVVAMSINV